MVRMHIVACAFLVSACANTTSPSSSLASLPGVETLSVAAIRETAPVASTGDSADDPAVWRNPVDPSESLIVTTDKSWGLNVYDLSGALLASAPAGLVNNVDLRADVLIGGVAGVLVGASDRSQDLDGRIALYALESAPANLRLLAHVPVEGDGVGKVYGFCLWRRSADQLFAFIPFNNGDVRQYALDLTGAEPRATLVRDIKLDSQTEGCVVDDRTGMVYVGEEERGVWRIDAAPDSSEGPVLFARVDNMRLVPDVEGLTIIPRGDTGGLLLVSSQADNAPAGSAPNENAYAAYDLETGQFQYRFRIMGSGDVDAVSDTDGLEFAPGNFGAPFEEGLLVVQDGDNAPDNQNFKMVPGSALKALHKRR